MHPPIDGVGLRPLHQTSQPPSSYFFRSLLTTYWRVIMRWLLRAERSLLLRPLARTNTPWRRQFHRSTSRRTVEAISAKDLQFGQPVHETHPHLLKPGESALRLSNLLMNQSGAMLTCCSYTRHHSTGVRATKMESRRPARAQLRRRNRWSRFKVSFRRRVL
jgi:hypothetical protein